MKKINLDKMGVYDYLGDSLLNADMTLRASTQSFYERVHGDKISREEWNTRHGSFYSTQLVALDSAVAEIVSAFKVLCTQKKQGLINFKLKDVLELCAENECEVAIADGYVYLDSFYEQLAFDIKLTHKYYASDKAIGDAA